MIVARVFLQQPGWLLPVILISGLFIAVLVRAYFQTAAGTLIRGICLLCKILGFGLLAICLLEPMISQVQPRTGENLMLIVGDDSLSMSIADAKQDRPRGELMREKLNADAAWLKRLQQDFDVRQFMCDARVRRVEDFESMEFKGRGSSLVQSINKLGEQFHDRPVVGVILFSDGIATDRELLASVDWSRLPPIYPVVIGSGQVERDIGITDVTVTQSQFEVAPVTIRAGIRTSPGGGASSEVGTSADGVATQDVVAELRDPAGETVERQTIQLNGNGETAFVRFQFQPLQSGVGFYQLLVARADEFELARDNQACDEPTMVNNRRQIMVQRNKGPFRVLYVSGRPNWEYKYLHRAAGDDEEIDLIGLIRIAKKEPKFEFRSRLGESTNPLFRGFDQDDEASEQYDEAVFKVMGDYRENELSDGFPRTEEELFEYDAIILDDVEAEFFRSDQMNLLKLFVSRRGGGLMMLGGAESFREGGYHRTPIGELLPIYLDKPEVLGKNAIDFSVFDHDVLDANKYRFDLMRDGWLSPWMRLRKTEQEERERLDRMPAFATANRVGRIKPGAELVASMTEPNGTCLPAIAIQNFGRGRSAAVTIGDQWRWGLKRDDAAAQDLEPAWRQTVRWLVGDVLQRVSCTVQHKPDDDGRLELQVDLLDEAFLPQDNGAVKIRVGRPDGTEIDLSATADTSTPGRYVAAFASRDTGGYSATIRATAADGSEIGSTQAGWVFEPAQSELARLHADREFAGELAAKTGGELIALDHLDQFVSGLSQRDLPIVETRISPLWHRWYFLLAAIGLLVTEWSIRRVNGLP